MNLKLAIAGALSLAFVSVAPAAAQEAPSALEFYAGHASAPSNMQNVHGACRGRRCRATRANSAQVDGHPLDIRTPSQLLSEAQRYLGSRKMTRMAGPWCRDFINLVASRAGYRLANRSRRAIDAVHLGARVTHPQPGDLVVMRHHVTIYAGHSHGRIVGLGGNQGRQVRYSHYSPSRVVAYVRL